MWFFDRLNPNRLLTEKEIRRNLHDRESPHVSPACKDAEIRFVWYLLLCLKEKRMPDFVEKGVLEKGEHVSGVRKNYHWRTVLLVSSSYAGWIAQDFRGNGKNLKLLRPVDIQPIIPPYREHASIIEHLAIFPDTKMFNPETQYIQIMFTLFGLNGIPVDEEKFLRNSTLFSSMYPRRSYRIDE